MTAAPLAGRDSAILPSVGHRPITLGMRLVHRLTSGIAARPAVLRNRVPLISFTFDDVPDSAVTTGATLLESYGQRGTFYVATALLGRTTADWRLADARAIAGLVARSHEVALHTHAHVPVAAMSRRAFAADLDQCARTLAGLTGGAASTNFAYPFGFSAFAHHRTLNAKVRSSRTTHPGINAGPVDLQFLTSRALGASLHDPAVLDRLVAETVARNGWLILTGHDVADRPSAYGCTPALLAACIEAALARGVIVAPVTQALDLCGID